MAERFPEHIALAPDPGTRRSADGRTFLGGSPLRLLRFTEAGAAAAARVLEGSEVPPTGADALVARRLLDAGLAHPRPLAVPEVTVSVVVPVRDDPAGVAALLDRLAAEALTDVVVVDADVEPGPGWLDPLLAHLHDPLVGVVAPRVRSRPGTTLLERYERHRSPLDLGPVEARVVPRSRVSYVPTAALVCRREALEALDGFDPSMRVGEDVDLVWRAVEAGWAVRYEPAGEVLHRPRPTWRAWAAQRRAYGSAAAALDRRHPGAVAPVELNAWSLAAWALAVLGGRRGVVAGTATAVASSLALAPKLRGRVEDPVPTALRLGGLGTLHAGAWLGRATWRAWLPAALVTSAVSRRLRVATAAAAVAPALLDRRAASRAGPIGVDPVRWVAIHAADQAAYAAGVWCGVLAERSPRCLLPRLSGIPGLVGKSGDPPGGG